MQRRLQIGTSGATSCSFGSLRDELDGLCTLAPCSTSIAGEVARFSLLGREAVSPA